MLRNLLIGVFSFFIIIPFFAKSPVSKNELVNIIDKVNSHWQETHANPGNAFWDNATYHTGNIEAYKVTGNEKYRLYSEKKDPKTGKRKNLGTFNTREAAKKHEKDVQYFKHG